MIPLLILGYRSVTLTVVSLIFTAVSGVMNIAFCLVKLKMPFSFRHYDFKLMREMWALPPLFSSASWWTILTGALTGCCWPGFTAPPS